VVVDAGVGEAGGGINRVPIDGDSFNLVVCITSSLGECRGKYRKLQRTIAKLLRIIW